MPSDAIEYRETRELPREQVLALYRANAWSSAEKPDELCDALNNSHGLVTAWDVGALVGLANAISDGSLVVYYPHALVMPTHQGRGIGRELLRRLMARYAGFHQQVILADGDATAFYEKCGFVRAGRTAPMWIFAGTEH